MKRKIHVIAHTHWDREWYFTTSRSSVYLMNNLSDILCTLEEDEDFTCFVLDGQTSLLQDYLAWMPQDLERIQKLVSENRLIIGPWYTQSDLILPSGESILRNLYYGMKDCEKLGACMKVAYVPDSFGQSANMPQIYQQFGIESTVFWRGVSDEMSDKTSFTWVGDDGTSVFATQIANGYYTAFAIPEDKEDREYFWNTVCIPSEAKRSISEHIYIANGFDQAVIRRNLPSLLAQRNEEDDQNEYCISSIAQYIDETKQAIARDHTVLEKVHGELLSAKQMRVHKSIYSSRADLKQMNTHIQNYLTHTLEPLMSISYALGHAYPHHAVEQVWRLLLENAAHDSIGSCISDSANEDVYMRYKKANDISESLVELHCRLMATHIKQKQDSFYTITLFNTLPYVYDSSISATLYVPEETFELRDAFDRVIPYSIRKKKDVTSYVKEQCIQMNPSQSVHMPSKIYEVQMNIGACHIPSMGYRQLHIVTSSSSEESYVRVEYMENEYYRIDIDDNGTFNVLDKMSGHVYREQGLLVDCGEDGDSFNYSPPEHDMYVTSSTVTSAYHMITNSFHSEAHISYTLVVPSNLKKRAQGICDAHIPVRMILGLKKGSPLIEIHMEIDNQYAECHKMCIQFAADIASRFNYADQQFGVIQRANVYVEEMASYERHLHKETSEVRKDVVNWDNDPDAWQEPMIPIEPTQSFVSICDDERGVAVYPTDVREYEITGEQDDTISITLFRTYGVMGRENLLYRPGRSSGERTIDTPDAQLLKTLSFDMAVYYYQGSFQEAAVAEKGCTYLSPPVAFGYGEFLNGRIIFAQERVEGHLPDTYSLVEKTGDLMISTIKKAEERDGYIIRLYNGLYQKEADAQLTFRKNIRKAYVVNAKEDILKELSIDGKSVQTGEVGHCGFITLLVEMNDEK